VLVVFSTSGDGYPRAAARLAGKKLDSLAPEDFIRLGETRRSEAFAAGAELGLRDADLVHLGFPDGAFGGVLEAVGAEVVHAPLTGQTESPTTGAPFNRKAAVDAFAELVESSRPGEIYTTDGADEHPDHRATHRLVCEVIKRTGSAARLFTFMVHAGRDQWPDPGPRFETKTIDGVVQPNGVEWPPPIRLPITPEEAEVKRRALMKHASQWALDHEYMGAFVKSEEVFWPA
jgi:LmbE family N-acetylglucosaminyl deacetylase